MNFGESGMYFRQYFPFRSPIGALEPAASLSLNEYDFKMLHLMVPKIRPPFEASSE